MPGIPRVAPILFSFQGHLPGRHSWYQHKGHIEMFLQMIDIKIILPFWASILGKVLHSALICKSGKECWARVSHGGGSHRFLWIHLGLMGIRPIIIFWINRARILNEALPWENFWEFWELKISRVLGPLNWESKMRQKKSLQVKLI